MPGHIGERNAMGPHSLLREGAKLVETVEDILAELRPQAKRLAVQAEQVASRANVGDELASALILVTHARWHEAASRSAATGKRLAGARAGSAARFS